jgi:hypothetical protein
VSRVHNMYDEFVSSNSTIFWTPGACRAAMQIAGGVTYNIRHQAPPPKASLLPIRLLQEAHTSNECGWPTFKFQDGLIYLSHIVLATHAAHTHTYTSSVMTHTYIQQHMLSPESKMVPSSMYSVPPAATPREQADSGKCPMLPLT